ncbi:ABC transporter permease [Petroclostridium sp. X23]|uniref:ABC transporter permease n=1 Tax=Petroclostridium sp. X23 TaxID=3045146 RepID=UPI0024ACD46D|nr:ABC transporter permease [Petroclostridium sp. X23]WHH59296.1 ABC transporter permease [Petroclostridium sp. X23]
MKAVEYFRMSFSSTVSNKLRTLLTILGIVIGISSVIIIVSIGKGGQAAILGELEKLGISGVNIKTKAGDLQSKDLLKIADADMIRKRIPQIRSVTPVFNGLGVVKHNNRYREAYLWGIDKEFRNIYSLQLLHGRLVNEADTRSQRKVVVIDNVLSSKLFHRENAVGRTLKLTSKKNTYNVTVIGIVKSSNEMFEELFGEQIPTFVYLPITTLQNIYDSDNVDHISIKIDKSENLDEIGVKVVKFLERIHNNEDKYYAENMMRQKEQVNNVTNILTFIIGAIAAVSLIVGGIGIMNIMLVSVKERTREIGIRKALGATRRNILIQFLIEAVNLTVIGGIMGVASGITLSWMICRFSGLPFNISVYTISTTMLFSAFIGLVFGVYPAKKAANLEPIEALRYE